MSSSSISDQLSSEEVILRLETRDRDALPDDVRSPGWTYTTLSEPEVTVILAALSYVSACFPGDGMNGIGEGHLRLRESVEVRLRSCMCAWGSRTYGI